MLPVSACDLKGWKPFSSFGKNIPGILRGYFILKQKQLNPVLFLYPVRRLIVYQRGLNAPRKVQRNLFSEIQSIL